MRRLLLSKTTFAVACILLSVGAGASADTTEPISTIPAVDEGKPPVTIDELQSRIAQLEAIVVKNETDAGRSPWFWVISIVAGVMVLVIAIVVCRKYGGELRNDFLILRKMIQAEEGRGNESGASVPQVGASAAVVSDGGSSESQPELLDVVRRFGRSLFVVITTVWVTIGLVPIFLVGLRPIIAGTIGDTFGAVNSWFSGLALAGVIVAVVMQTIELRYQRRELRQTHAELARSAEAANESQKQLTKQTELSFLGNYLNVLEKLIQHSVDPEKRPEDGMTRWLLVSKLQVLLEQMERDELGMSLMVRADQRAEEVRWNAWLQRLENIHRDLSAHWSGKRANNRTAFEQGKAILKVCAEQLEELRFADDPEWNEKLLNLSAKFREIGETRIRVELSQGHIRGVPSPYAEQFETFWQQGEESIETLGQLIATAQAERPTGTE